MISTATTGTCSGWIRRQSTADHSLRTYDEHVGIGLTVPGATRIQPGLVPAAAVGIMIVAVSATIWHLMRGEYSSAATTTLLLAISSFVAFMRWRRLPAIESPLPRSLLVRCPPLDE